MSRPLYQMPTVPSVPPAWFDQRKWGWPPMWLQRAGEEARDHFMLLSEVGDRWCIYCGEDATDADHLVPLPVSGPQLRRFVPTVPACSSCNGTLSDFHSPIVLARAALIAERLHRRYQVRCAQQVDDRLNSRWHELTKAERSELSDLALRLYHLEWGGLLRAIRDRVMPPPNLNYDLHERV